MTLTVPNFVHYCPHHTLILLMFLFSNSSGSSCTTTKWTWDSYRIVVHTASSFFCLISSLLPWSTVFSCISKRNIPYLNWRKENCTKSFKDALLVLYVSKVISIISLNSSKYVNSWLTNSLSLVFFTQAKN